MDALPTIGPQVAAGRTEPSSEMARLVHAMDWSRTALGRMEQWPLSLRTSAGTVLGSKFPMLLWWGPELLQIYNDAYRPIFGDKHPRALGATAREVWSEIWHIVGPMAEGIWAGGSATWSEHLLLPMQRKGFLEETYFTFSYSPVPDDLAQTGGVLVTCQETTAQVLSERRMRTLQKVASVTVGAPNGRSAVQTAITALAENPGDLPFAAAYLLDEDGERLTAAASTGIVEALPTELSTIDLQGARADWALNQVFQTRCSSQLALPQAVANLVARDSLPPPTCAAVIPLEGGPGERPVGVLVFGLSGRLAFDATYRSFLDLAAGQISSAFAQAEALAQERRRAEALATLDKAKTTFFSNVSHEFRTPLTLMLGPLEESLRDVEEPLLPGQRERQEMIRRNSLRLLKLVNALLDFSRIEVGRMKANYRPTDLSVSTADLASTFRSMVEKVGLALEVDCAALTRPVFVDHEMWEKIVLNLLSNAFKFTFEGRIRVELLERDGAAVLEVSDTGVGIPEQELPRLFERFHRVEGTRGRTYEGTGIGLALVRELVHLHGGTVAVDSAVHRGTRFTVSIPLGSAHLPPEHVDANGGAVTRISPPYDLEDVAQWMQGPADAPTSAPRITDDPLALAGTLPVAGHVLLVEDNADMRRYVTRLLEDAACTVTAVGDGEAALAFTRKCVPDLVVTDVMMPKVDGLTLLRSLRVDAQTKAVPVIILSARAGEDARLESLQAGADDFLLKPFSARELTARVRIHLELSRIRSEAEAQRRSLNEMFMEAPAMIAILNGPDHVFELANPLYLRAVGSRDVLGKPIREALPELCGQEFIPLLDQTYRTGIATSGVEATAVLDRHGNGTCEEAFFNFCYRPTRDRNGAVEGIIVFAFDVTEQVQARRRAEALSEELKLAAQRKDEFLAMLAHELRNPMAAISMSLSLLERSGTDETRARKHRDTARRQMQTLVRLVDDLLDVSRITRGTVELRKEAVDLTTIVQNAITATRPAIEEQGHAISINVAPGPYQVDADATRLEQVVANLLTNAAKYTASGGTISVSVTREQRGELEWAVTRVKDTGRGIPPEMLEQVFELFVQVDPSIDRQSGGLGLGLTLVKQLVALHGGEVAVHSDGPGKGSDFIVRLPLQSAKKDVVLPSAEDACSGTRPVAAPQRRIVIVEDSVDLRDVLQEFLQSLGHHVQVAANGIEGVQRLLDEKPDVALVDVGLPGLDGYEVARRVRSSPHGRNMFLVALTGYGGEEARDKAGDAGFDLHLTKPIDIDELPRVVTSARSQQ